MFDVYCIFDVENEEEDENTKYLKNEDAVRELNVPTESGNKKKIQRKKSVF